ncbi:MAG: c-type cytochrome biogenesis protein CcmI [Ahrensia sp.]
MTFWILAFIILVVVLLAIVLPVYHKSKQLEGKRAGEFAHDVEVYRDQLRELTTEIDRGLIGEEDAKQARTEIARRLLAAEQKASEEQQQRDNRRHRFGSVVLASTVLVFIPALTLLVYTEVGSPELEAQPLAPRVAALEEERLAQRQARQQMIDLVQRAEAHLADNPNDGRGWDVLAPVYFRAGEPAKAATAYRNAIRLIGENSTRLSGLGEAIFAMSGGVINAEAEQNFNQALALDVNDGRAQFYLALAQLQQGDVPGGTQAWQRIADDASVGSDWRGAADEGLRRLAAGDMTQIPGMASATPPPAQGMPQLDAETIQQGQAMNSDDQAAMIAGMVSNLDARLRDNPQDEAGWQRLIRAYTVMGQRENAADALKRAIASFPENAQIVTDLKSFGASLGLEAVAETN